MYAVIESGGKQYRVALGDRVRLETLDVETGDVIAFDKVLAVSDDAGLTLGTPHLDTAVNGRVVAHGRGDKVRIVKFKRRQNYHRTLGHRQNYTEVEITSIGGVCAPAKPPSSVKASEAAPAPAPAPESSAGADEAAQASTTTGADDLTRINGVGPTISEKLNALGVTRFEQIAGWTTDDVARMDEQLSFKGRIDREEWIAQATQLMQGEDKD